MHVLYISHRKYSGMCQINNDLHFTQFPRVILTLLKECNQERFLLVFYVYKNPHVNNMVIPRTKLIEKKNKL
jgi:hypothetical protein